MTIEEFNAQRFGAGDRAIYNGKIYDVASCDFEEQLIGLVGVVEGSEEISWVRCENVEYISAIRKATT